MAYDRYESRRGWRDPRSRFSDDFRERGEDRFGRDRGFDRDDDRGFFERAGDEIASWFGDDEAERRRREEGRMGRSDDDGSRRARAFMSDDEFSRYDRSPRFRDEGYRRPYTGRFAGRGGFGGGEDRFDRGTPPERGWSERWERAPSRREFSGTAAGLHDPHYSEWRQRQIEALDRDYDDYRRENQNRFENEFSSW
ncbi:MAG: SWFGD domain-containing protein, partial [Sphingomicrobium sp.]